MRIARFRVAEDPVYGVVEGPDGQEVVHQIAGDPLYTPVAPTGLTHRLEDVHLLAPVIPRSKVIGVAHNYAEPGEPAPRPVYFAKPNTSVIGPGDPIRLDPSVQAPAYLEAELAVVIGRVAKDVPRERASEVILGYTVVNDVGYRFPDPETDPRAFFAKFRDTFTPLGPWIVTDLDLSQGLAVRSWVDGEQRQDGVSGQMVAGVGEVVATASSTCTLLPGDLILTGTPAGASPIRVGERVTCEVEGVGAITNPVLAG